MGRRWTDRRRFSLLALSLACLTALALLMVGVGNALAAQQVITSAGPINNIYLNDDLACQATHTGDTSPEFYDGTNPGACGTFLSTGGTSYGPTVPAGLSRTDFTPVSQSAVTGSGTSTDPYAVVTTVNVGSTGLQITQADSYVVGEEQYRTDIVVSNSTASPITATLYHAGDCYLQGSDTGYGWIDTANNGIYCSATVNNNPPGRIIGFQDLIGGSNYIEGAYSTVWNDITAAGGQFPNTCDCTTDEDNGAGLSWPLTVPAGGETTVSLQTVMSPTGTTPPLPTPTPTPTPTPPTTTTSTPAQPASLIPVPVGATQASTTAAFSGLVNPEGQSTMAYFEYGLDPAYTGGAPFAYTDQVTAQPNPVGSDFNFDSVSATATGLVPNALYHVRLVAVSASGTVYGPDFLFNTSKAALPTAPVLGQSVNAVPVAGRVYVKVPGAGSRRSTPNSGPGFVPLTMVRNLPVGTQFDTRTGAVKLITASATSKTPQSAVFSGVDLLDRAGQIWKEQGAGDRKRPGRGVPRRP